MTDGPISAERIVHPTQEDKEIAKRIVSGLIRETLQPERGAESRIPPDPTKPFPGVKVHTLRGLTPDETRKWNEELGNRAITRDDSDGLNPDQKERYAQLREKICKALLG